MKKNKKHRRRLKRFFAAVVLIALLWVFNNFTLKVSKTEVKDELINDEITLVQLTDLHGMSFGKANSAIKRKIKKISPDIIVVTGDMFTYPGGDEGEETAFELISSLAKEYKIFYVNGEHDDNEDFFKRLENAGVTVLNYKDEVLKIKNTEIHLYGIDNVYYSPTFDLKNAFKKDDKNFSVLLAHIPNFKSFASFGIDLSLCGDTHGGMFRLPVIGAVISQGGFFPDLRGEYTKGLYELNGSKMFISSGLGDSPFPIRFFNRPEIAVIKLMPNK